MNFSFIHYLTKMRGRAAIRGGLCHSLPCLHAKCVRCLPSGLFVLNLTKSSLCSTDRVNPGEADEPLPDAVGVVHGVEKLPPCKVVTLNGA